LVQAAISSGHIAGQFFQEIGAVIWGNSFSKEAMYLEAGFKFLFAGNSTI
jgi:hypothetical protein